MPNWCYTRYTIKTEDKGAKKLFNLLEKWQEEGTIIKHSWDNNWLGLVVEKGLEMDPLSEEIECIGWISNLELDCDNKLFVSVNTAWKPMHEMWLMLVDKYIPGANIIYTSIEQNIGIYQTNEPELKNAYIIDSFDSEYDSDYKAEEKYVRTFLFDTYIKAKENYPERFKQAKKYMRKYYSKASTLTQIKTYFRKGKIERLFEIMSEIVPVSNIKIRKWEFKELIA